MRSRSFHGDTKKIGFESKHGEKSDIHIYRIQGGFQDVSLQVVV